MDFSRSQYIFILGLGGSKNNNDLCKFAKNVFGNNVSRTGECLITSIKSGDKILFMCLSCRASSHDVNTSYSFPVSRCNKLWKCNNLHNRNT
jgi:hypothetical protein